MDRTTEEISSENVSEVNMVDLTPRNQAERDLNELGIRGQNAEKIRKKLIAHNALVAEIKDASRPLAGKRRQALHGFVMGKIVKKYRVVVNLIRKEIGVSRNVRSRVQKKTMTNSPKKSRLFQWHTTMKGKIIDFLKRGDNSTCLPRKRDSKKVGDQQLQKYILNDYLENLHIKFLAENPTVHLSYSTFTRMRLKEMIPVSYSSRKTCLCEKHQNFSLKLVPLKNVQLINAVNPDVFRKSYTTDEKLDEVLDKIDTEEIMFSQWKRINVEKDGKTTKKIKLIDTTQSPAEFATNFKAEFHLFCEHAARAKEQYEQIKQLKIKMLMSSHVIAQLDFAQNYSCQALEEVQSAYSTGTILNK